MSDRRVFGVRLVGANRTHHHFAGVYADPDLQIHPLFGPEAFCAPPDVILHPKRGVECTLRMVFMRNRSAEQGKNAVSR
jgi:hypothetical protein